MTTPGERYRRFLETLTPETLPDLKGHMHPDVHFKDPFNDVYGTAAMTAVFEDMFENVGSVRFTVHDMLEEGERCVLRWQFEATLLKKPWRVDGVSWVTFSSDGLVSEHVDYWDAAANFYERLPAIGWLIGRIRARLSID
jgi:predicted ester cyclase